MANQGDVRKVDNEIAKKAEKPPSNFQDVMDAKTRAKEDKAIAAIKKDVGERFRKGGTTQQRINKQDTKHGMLDLPVANLNRMAGMKKGGSVKKSKMNMGGMAGMKKGGMPMKDGKPAFMAKFAKGGGIESHGKTKGTIIKMAAGGSVSSRADGIAQRGKTKFKNY